MPISKRVAETTYERTDNGSSARTWRALKPALAALAVVIRDDHVLLVRRKKEPDACKWGFAGGHVEWGETALDAAARELREETSVIAEPLKYITNIDVISADPATQDSYHFLLTVVLCKYISGEPQAADDVSAARWFPISHVATLEMSDHVQEVIAMVQA